MTTIGECLRFEQPHLILTCPGCRQLARWHFLQNCNRTDGEVGVMWHFLKCTVCLRAVLVEYEYESGKRADRPKNGRCRTYPGTIPIVPAELKGKAAEAYKEAALCYSVGAWNAVGAMCRRALEQLLIDKGASGTHIPSRLASFAASHVVHPQLMSMANRLRILGRDGVHADDAESAKTFMELNQADAEAALEFCQLFIDATLSLPARIAAAEERRPK